MQPAPGAGGSFREGKCLSAVFVAEVGELLGDLVERLVPGDLLPLAAAALAGALQRSLQTVGVVHEAVKITLLVQSGTHKTFVVGAIRIALDVHDSAVLLRYQNAAADVAEEATSTQDLDVVGSSHWFLFLSSYGSSGQPSVCFSVGTRLLSAMSGQRCQENRASMCAGSSKFTHFQYGKPRGGFAMPKT